MLHHPTLCRLLHWPFQLWIDGVTVNSNQETIRLDASSFACIFHSLSVHPALLHTLQNEAVLGCSGEAGMLRLSRASLGCAKERATVVVPWPVVHCSHFTGILFDISSCPVQKPLLECIEAKANLLCLLCCNPLLRRLELNGKGWISGPGWVSAGKLLYLSTQGVAFKNLFT